MRQFASHLIVWIVLIIASAALIGCNAPSTPFPTPTVPAPTKTAVPTDVPTATSTAMPASTNTPTATNTPTITPTITPTPTRLPIPTPALPPGWKKLQSAQIELGVPATFIGGEPAREKDSILKNLRALGPEYVSSAKIIDQNPALFAIYAIDSRLGTSGFLTSITVTVNQIVSTGPTNTLQGGVSQQLLPQYTVLDERTVLLGYYSAERMLIVSPAQGTRTRQLVYTITSLNTAWVVAFSTVEDEFFQRLPVFEQSMQTLRFKP
jgi:hypothetical protein